MVGENRQPSVKDRSQLPYTEAVLMEIQRYANIIPGGVQHVCIRDLTVNDVTIPAGTLIQPQMTQLLKVKNISLNCFKNISRVTTGVMEQLSDQRDLLMSQEMSRKMNI